MSVLLAVCVAASVETVPMPMTLPDAYARARVAAGSIRASAARVDEARGRLVAARAPRSNPELEVAAGRRGERAGALEPAPRLDLEFGVAQPLELGGARSGRVRAATAAIDREVAAAADVTRRLLAEVGVHFYQASRDAERARVAAAGERAAEELLRVARVRLEQGDVAALDVNLAQTIFARAKAARIGIAAERTASLSVLKALLQLSRDVELAPVAATDVDVLAPPMAPPDWTDVLVARPELRVLDAEVREATAEVEIARALRWPGLTPAVRYSRDEGTPIVWGGLTVSLPLLNRGDGERLVAEARVRRAVIELETTRTRIEAEMKAAYDTYVGRREAALTLGALMTTLGENLDLARRSYESGQIGLGELLVVRRETLDARSEAIDVLFGAAIARVQLEAAMGVLR